jgi:hypothetical protein
MFTPLPDNGDDDDKVEIHSTPPLHQRCLTKLHLPSETFALINATFVAVATILGTGILALPVKLSHSGMGPFVFTFTLCLGMQLCTVVLMVELLQRTHAQIGVDTMQKKKQNNKDDDEQRRSLQLQITKQEGGQGKEGKQTEHRPNQHQHQHHHHQAHQKGETTQELTGLDRDGDGDRDTTTSIFNQFPVPTLPTHEQQQNPLALHPKNLPDLHRMGQYFLQNKWMAFIFDCSVVLHFCAAMISYNLAGPEAYGDLFSLPYDTLIFPFWLVYVLFIILGRRIVPASISIFTFFKCTLFVAVLIATDAVGKTTNIEQKDDWKRVMEPYLVGTFALGGVVNTMPVTYAFLPFQSLSHIVSSGSGNERRAKAMRSNKKMLERYRIAVCIGKYEKYTSLSFLVLPCSSYGYIL